MEETTSQIVRHLSQQSCPMSFRTLTKFFWNSVDNHNRSSERFIGRMSHCLTDVKVRGFKTFKVKDRMDSEILGYLN